MQKLEDDEAKAVSKKPATSEPPQGSTCAHNESSAKAGFAEMKQLLTQGGVKRQRGLEEPSSKQLQEPAA